MSYLATKSLGKDLDATLRPAQRADGIACRAFLAAHAAPLLDLSLYVSAANWAAATRPAYSALLPFPLTWTVPTLLRAAAIRRVDHLGLAELDSDFDPSGVLHLSTGRDALPETLRRHIPVMARKTVRDEMTPEQAAAIKLYGLADDCMTTLDGFMAEGGGPEGQRLRFFGSDEVSSLDCLAYGYLTLMRHAPVPRSFVKESLEQKAPRLSKFVDSMAACLQQLGEIPRANPQPTSFLQASSRLFDTTVRHIPSLGDLYATESRTRAERGAKGWDGRIMMLTVQFLFANLATGLGVYFYRTLQPFGARHQTWGPSDGGVPHYVADMLAHAFDLGPQAASGSLGLNRSAESRFAETDTEVE